MRRVVFLDRDGTLIEDNKYVHRIEDLRLLDGVVEGLTKLMPFFDFIIITNQPGIGKGIFSYEQYHRFNEALVSLLSQKGIRIERTYFCPHAEECECRKPSTKFVLEAAKDFGIDLAGSWSIGDHPSDVKMGSDAGCRTVYVLTGHGRKHLDELRASGCSPTAIAQDFLKAAETIISLKDENAR